MVMRMLQVAVMTFGLSQAGTSMAASCDCSGCENCDCSHCEDCDCGDCA